MAESGPSKNDINMVFKRLRLIPANKTCFDCNAKNPTWASVTYGVFICIDCSAIHRSLGVHVSFVRSTQLDTNWMWLQLRAMQLGGNANAISFFTNHNCTSTDTQQKYNSRAAQLYREKLHQSAVSAMRIHGTKLHLDVSSSEPVTTPEEKEVDFFEEIVENTWINVPEVSDDACLSRQYIANESNQLLEGPRVESPLSTSPTEAMRQAETRKPTIGQRKPAAAKKGLGAKKGGLGAQKVNANFSEIEREAQLADQLREQMSVQEKMSQEKRMEAEAKQISSINLAYQDLSAQRKKEEDRMRQVDPRKASQIERLGMGFGTRGSGVSHSATSEMKTIEQEIPAKASQMTKGPDLDDDFEILEFSSGPPKYSDSPFTKSDRYNVKSEDKSGISNVEVSWSSLRKKPAVDNPHEKRKASEKSQKPFDSQPTSNEALTKFGNAKSISSEQFFKGSTDNDFEKRANLARFEGSSSISSAEYFGDSSGVKNRQQQAYATPDLDDIKEGVRAGVTKVAGKLSSLANGVMSSIQDRYGY